MKHLRRQLRLLIFEWLVRLAIQFLPNDCTATWRWVSEKPFEL